VTGRSNHNFAPRSDLKSALVVFSHLSFTYLPVYLAAAAAPGFHLVGLWLWFGICKNGLINLMHECAHQLTFRRSWANEFVGGAVLAPLLITDFKSYRERHWEHHRHLGTPKDLKLVYHTDIRGRRIVSLVLRSVFGVEAFRRLTELPTADAGKQATKRSGISLRTLTVQALFSASVLGVSLTRQESTQMALVSAALAYSFVYAYGMLSLTVLAAALRAIAEHQISDDGAATEGNAALRNLHCNPLTRLSFGAYGFGEHATHHMRPSVPYYQLPALTTELARNDAAMVPGRGYLSTIVSLVLSREQSED
jgi:fatty acid desaturase